MEKSKNKLRSMSVLWVGGRRAYQSGERLTGSQEVSGSIPLISTKKRRAESARLFFYYSAVQILFGGQRVHPCRQHTERVPVMVIHESAEDYLESILVLQQRRGQVRSIDIVNELGYSKPSVSIAMKKLRENGYINMDADGSITLNESGMAIASRVYGRHKTLSKLFELLGVSPEVASEDACKVEHDLSEETYRLPGSPAHSSSVAAKSAASTAVTAMAAPRRSRGNRLPVRCRNRGWST